MKFVMGVYKMKTVKNHAPKASALLLERAEAVNIAAKIIDKARPHIRKHHVWGSTYSPQKVITLDEMRMSLGQASEYITAVEKRMDETK